MPSGRSSTQRMCSAGLAGPRAALEMAHEQPLADALPAGLGQDVDGAPAAPGSRVDST